MKPSRRMRFLFALAGAAACLVAALLAEAIFGALDTSDRLARRNTPSLLFVDSFGRRLQREGGRTGDVRITLVWNNRNDLDLWCEDPSGERIFYGDPRARSGGRLDVDMNANPRNTSDEPVENIFWPAGGAPRGEYRVLVHHFRNHGASDPTPYQVEVYNHGVTRTFEGQVSHGEEARPITQFTATTGPSARRLPAGFLHALLVSGFWAALLALALFGALAWGLYLVFGRPPLSRRWWARRAALAAGAGLLAGAAGQGLFSALLTVLPGLPDGLPRLLGWLALALILGFGLSGLVPCMPRRRALGCAIAGGLLAPLGFQLALASGDSPARVVAAMLLGAAIGWAFTVVLPEARPEPEEPARILAPVTVRAHELVPTGVLSGRKGGSRLARRLTTSGAFPAAPSRDGRRPETPFHDA